ncbi:hypothetical protein ACFYWX_20355 [Streptomyces sp. NPDC002888]|uniref:hypothetical protein n=1 Tax=Streptomyces sp. NPDC002888 TaxID=3364668 RepID=UPI00369823C8
MTSEHRGTTATWAKVLAVVAFAALALVVWAMIEIGSPEGTIPGSKPSRTTPGATRSASPPPASP